MISTNLKVAVLSLLVASAQAKTQSVYSFAEGRSHPEGLQHGVRGHACLKDFHASLNGGGLEFLKEKHGEELTDEHVAAAIFMAFGEKGIDNLCSFNGRWKESQERRLSSESAEKNLKRRTQTACTLGVQK